MQRGGISGDAITHRHGTSLQIRSHGILIAVWESILPWANPR